MFMLGRFAPRRHAHLVHFGDLHITHSGEQNYHDFLQLITHANANLAANVNFAVLPGADVEDGTDEQFLLVQQAIDRLAIPLEILPGDHDAKDGGSTRCRRRCSQNSGEA